MGRGDSRNSKKMRRIKSRNLLKSRLARKAEEKRTERKAK